jgi:hypothetical protein
MNRRAARAVAIACLMVLSLAIAFSASAPSQAQDQKGDLELRTIRGGVIDKNENPAPGSVVYLLNVKTQSVKTYIADQGGLYRFSGLDPNVDYEVHAEQDDMTSSIRTVSSFDSRRDIQVFLKLSHAKKSATK